MRRVKHTAALAALRSELRYHQAMVRLDMSAARRGMAKCREIGAKMRALQAAPAPNGNGHKPGLGVGVSTGKKSKRAKAKA